MEEKMKKIRYEKIVWKQVLTASFFPVAIYVYFCARNFKELSTLFILASSTVLFLIAVIVYFAVYLIVRRCYTAMIFCLSCWIGCYATNDSNRELRNRIWLVIQKIFGIQCGKMVFNVMGLLLSAILFTALLCRIKQKETVTQFIFLVSLILLIVNGSSIVLNVFGKLKADDSFGLKTKFVKSDGHASPNIYWIHPDGMMGFDAFEKYYGDSQEVLEESLINRGFEISRSANFESGHSTSIAIPILASPYAYDTWISQYMVSSVEAIKMSKNTNIMYRLQLLNQKEEFQTAFSNIGYTINTIGLYGYWYPAEGGYFWSTGNDLNWVQKYNGQDWTLSVKNDLYNIATINSYFYWCSKIITDNIRKFAEYGVVSEYRAHMPDEEARAVLLEAYQKAVPGKYQDVLGLYDVLNGGYASPRLTIIHNGIAHYPFCFNEDGSMHESSMDSLDYYSQHIYSGKVVTAMVDMIIDADPDAVIVIQADHGLHGNTEEDFIRAFGEKADAVEIWNSTISAVRIPEQYRNGEEKYMMDTPLNIVRYLVNNFVGRNYEYITVE